MLALALAVVLALSSVVGIASDHLLLDQDLSGALQPMQKMLAAARAEDLLWRGGGSSNSSSVCVASAAVRLAGLSRRHCVCMAMTVASLFQNMKVIHLFFFRGNQAANKKAKTKKIFL